MCVCVLQQITIRTGSISVTAKILFLFFFFWSLFYENPNFSFCFLCIAVYHVSHVPSPNDCTGLTQMQPQSLHEGFKEVSRKASESRFGVRKNQHQKFLRRIKSTGRENRINYKYMWTDNCISEACKELKVLKKCSIHCRKCATQLNGNLLR